MKKQAAEKKEIADAKLEAAVHFTDNDLAADEWKNQKFHCNLAFNNVII